ncbi:MAG: hypothetical protein MJY76_01905 [Bacteroidales bacterium]|nr:hypothetical protein [Bacteroidales bacterium]
MKRIMTVIAVMAAVLSSCSKSEPESGRKNANEEITLNISVSNPSNSSKALIKSDWAVGDRILIWYDGNTQTEPDMAIKYDGSKWNNDTDVEVSVNTPAESGYLKALYDGAVKVTARDEYTYSNGILTARLQTWTFLTEIQVVVSNISADDASKCALSCNGFTPCTGYSVEAGAITAKTGKKGVEVTGISNPDGVAFVFASADRTALIFEFMFKNYSSIEVPKAYKVDKSISGDASTIKAIKIDYRRFEIPYVVIEGVKWTRENLAITASGKRDFNGTGHVNGDYFQWAAHAGYCGDETDADKGLLIYKSFTSTMCGDSSNGFKFKSPEDGKKYQFNTSSSGNSVGISPYYKRSSYTKYNGEDKKTILEKCDDVASIILGGSWRMPTTTDFKNMYNATKWTWISTDKGFYVTNKGEDLASDKSNALLFFPVAGSGDDINLFDPGIRGNYWSSSLASSDSDRAYRYYYFGGFLYPQSSDYRYIGCTVRPVSD